MNMYMYFIAFTIMLPFKCHFIDFFTICSPFKCSLDHFTKSDYRD